MPNALGLMLLMAITFAVATIALVIKGPRAATVMAITTVIFFVIVYIVATIVLNNK